MIFEIIIYQFLKKSYFGVGVGVGVGVGPNPNPNPKYYLKHIITKSIKL